jgi:hypothetical protein
MELTLDEVTLLTIFRSLDENDKKELLRHASLQHKMDEAALTNGLTLSNGQCRLERSEERPEIAAEPIFTE